VWPVSVESTWLFIVFGVLHLLCFSLLSILSQNLGLEECIVSNLILLLVGGGSTRCCWYWSELWEILLFLGGLKSAWETDWSSSVELSSRFVCRSWGVAWLLELLVCPGMRSWEAFILEKLQCDHLQVKSLKEAAHFGKRREEGEQSISRFLSD
jgi:hypothetical protein